MVALQSLDTLFPNNIFLPCSVEDITNLDLLESLLFSGKKKSQI